jgi:CBS domain-containing protein
VTVADLIGTRQDVYAVREDITVHQAARYLRDRQIRSVGVVDSSRRLVGVLSQSDISDKIVAENKWASWIQVSEIMTENVVTVTADLSIDACLRLLEQHSIHHLPVVASTGEYCGMVSVTDLLQTVVCDEKSRADLLESFIFSGR